MAINPISPALASAAGAVRGPGSVGGSPAASPTEQVGKTFSEMLDSLTRSELQTDEMVNSAAAGGDVDLHDLMIGMEQTDIEFRVAMAIRDKLVDAYREVMRMQV